MKAPLFFAGILTGLLLAGMVAIFHHPATVYSFAPQIFPTGIEVDESVNAAGSGLKHGRTSSFQCTQAGCGAQINWTGTAFANTNYTAVCTVENGSTEFTASVGEKTTTFVFVNLPISAERQQLVIDCIAMHD